MLDHFDTPRGEFRLDIARQERQRSPARPFYSYGKAYSTRINVGRCSQALSSPMKNFVIHRVGPSPMRES